MTALEFHNCCDVRPAAGSMSNFFSREGDGRCQSSEVFAVQVAVGAGVYQESVASQNHHGLDTFALSEGPHEVVNGGQ